MFKRRCAWNLKIEIFWGLVLVPPSSKYQKEFVIPTAAFIFRALCRKRSRAAKPKKRSGKDSRSQPAAKFCAANRRGVICFRPKTRSASGTSAKWRGSIRPTKRGSKRTSRLARSHAGWIGCSAGDAKYKGGFAAKTNIEVRAGLALGTARSTVH